MTIINIKNNSDNSLITLDLRLKEIRVYKKFLTIPLSNNDIEGYEYILNQVKEFNNNDLMLDLIFKCIKSDLKDYGYKVKKKDLEVLK